MAGSFYIKIKFLTGNNINILVNENVLVNDVKKSIYMLMNISIDRQRLVFLNREMENEKTLGYYNIKTNENVYFVYKY